MGIEGVVDCVTNTHVDGWVYRDDDPSEHLVVTVHLGGRIIGVKAANQQRNDLRDEGIGEGDHAYFIDLDEPIDDGQFGKMVVFATSQNGERIRLPLPIDDTVFPELNGHTAVTEDSLPRQHLEKLLKFGISYAEAAELLPPVGLPADFIDESVLADSSSWIKQTAEELRAAILRDTYPIPHPQNREGYADGFDLTYWLSGYADFRMIQGLAEEYGVLSGRYFDFGGSTGRVFRNFAIQTDAWEVWTCDFKISSVEFNLQYFPSSIRTFLNTNLPSLPIPDSCFDLISACSVFTHIDEGETSWLLELRRTLKVGGIACISIHSKETWERKEGELQEYVAEFRPDIADEPVLPAGKTVVTFRQDDPYRCQTFHSDEYIYRNWGRFFEICEIRPLVLGIQAMVICRRVD
ncbi:MAG: class I SAM-dependent methyltransferase [Terracidiphilus sp.]|jgi:ubiquinone/menaquinone biosynthesis C-methylase UbiE